MNIEWNAEKIAEIILKHYDLLSPSDKLYLQQTAARTLRKIISQQMPKNSQ